MLSTEVDRDLLMSIEFKRFQFQPDVNADRRDYQRLVDLGWIRRLDALSYETTNASEAQCAKSPARRDFLLYADPILLTSKAE